MSRPPRSETNPPVGTARERLLAAANELFYEEGIHTVGIDRVIERAGVAKASLYSTFGSKDDLVQAYLTERAEIRRERITARVQGQIEPRAKLLAIFDELCALVERPQFRGCAFINASAEGPRESSITRVCAFQRNWLRELMTMLAREMGAEEPTFLANQLQLIYDGALVAASLDRDIGAAARARETAEILIAGQLPGVSAQFRTEGQLRRAVTRPDTQAEPRRPSNRPDTQAEPRRPSNRPDTQAEPRRASNRPDADVEPRRAGNRPDADVEPRRAGNRPDTQAEPRRASNRPDTQVEPRRPSNRAGDDTQVRRAPARSNDESMILLVGGRRNDDAQVRHASGRGNDDTRIRNGSGRDNDDTQVRHASGRGSDDPHASSRADTDVRDARSRPSSDARRKPRR